MHRVEGAKRGARQLLLLVALWAAAGAVIAAIPADAAEQWQQCSAVKGSLVMTPGLTDVPADQSISFFARVTNCSGLGGSALLGATTGASQATCANLTTVLLPTNATFAWANGRTSTVALAFHSRPGSPNRLILEGRVLSGPGQGHRVDGGLHVSAKFSRTLRNAAQNHKRVNQSRREELGPLNGESGDCTVAKPIGTIKVASFESLKFAVTDPPPSTTTTAPAPVVIIPNADVTTTTVAPPKTAVAPVPAARPRPKPRPPARPPVIRPLGAVGDSGTSDAGLDPETALGAICIGGAAVLLVVLLVPSRRMRRRRASARLLR